MGIFDAIFRAPQANQQPQPNAQKQQEQGNNGQQPAAAGQPPAEGSTLERGTQAGGKTINQGSPLDPYNDLFKNAPNTESQPNGEGNPNPNGGKPAGKQATDFGALSKNLNFSRQISPELLQKATSGDAGALGQIIDQVGRMAFAASGKLADQLHSRGISEFESKFSESLPGRFREYSLQNTPVEHKVLQHPAVKPMVEAIRSQMAQRFPEASTAELQKQAEDYFMAFHKEMGNFETANTQKTEEQANAGTQAEALKQQQAGTYDWDSWLGS